VSSGVGSTEPPSSEGAGLAGAEAGAVAKFERLAGGYSAHDYADPARYGERRAEVALELAQPLPAGASVLDLGCGDGNLAGPLLARGLRYRGVDGSAAMVAEARRHLPEGTSIEVALIDGYVPPEPVDLTLCMRAFYYPPDRRAFFRKVAGYTRSRFVFDFEPRVFAPAEIAADLRASGFERIVFRPFFLPQRVAVPAPVRAALTALERAGPLAHVALRVRGVLFCAATPSRG
jgi:SAM-dependent methyltransferase